MWKGVGVRFVLNLFFFYSGVVGYVFRTLFFFCEVWGMGGLMVFLGFFVC